MEGVTTIPKGSRTQVSSKYKGSFICEVCKRIVLKPSRRKMCKRCYDVWLYATNPIYRERAIKNVSRWRKNNPEKFKACCQKPINAYKASVRATEYHYKKDFSGMACKVFERDGYSCQTCGRDQSVIRLHIHHKNKNHSDNSVENLITLCTTCHLRLHNSKLQRSRDSLNLQATVRGA